MTRMNMKAPMAFALLAALAGCGGMSAEMDARSRACSAQGGVLTGMGCQRGGMAVMPMPGRVGNAPATDRYGQPNYNAQGQYVGPHGEGALVDRPPQDAATPTAVPMPPNVVCTQNAAGNAGSCTSR